MRTKSILAVATAVSLLAASPFVHLGRDALWIPYWPCPPQTVDEGSSCSWTGPECPSDEELRALNEAFVNGDPPPPGFAMSGHVNHEIARTTGAIDWFGRHEVAVTVTDGADRLQSARLYLDDRLMSEATRENGGVVDLSDEAEAVVRFFLPWLPPYTVRLVTLGFDGRETESSISIGRVPNRSK